MPGGDRGPIPAGVITLSEAQVPFSVTLPGRAIAYEEVNIRPRVDGTISEIPYEAGRKVEKGDVLFRIEGDTFEVDVAAAEAEVARAEAAVTAAEATLSRYERLQGTGVTIEDVENARRDGAAEQGGAELGKRKTQTGSTESGTDRDPQPDHGHCRGSRSLRWGRGHS